MESLIQAGSVLQKNQKRKAKTWTTSKVMGQTNLHPSSFALRAAI